MEQSFKVPESSWNTANDEGWRTFLTYVGSSCISVQSRFKVLDSSWNTAKSIWSTTNKSWRTFPVDHFANEVLHCVTMVKVVEVIPGVFVMWGLWPSERK